MNQKYSERVNCRGRANLAARKQVVHLVTSLDFGGVERYIEIIARQASVMQFQPIFFAINGGGATENILRDLGVRVECMRLSPKIPNFKVLFNLVKYLRKIRPLVIHTHGAEANFHGLVAAWLAGVPVCIGEEIGMPSHSKAAKIIFKLVYLSAKKVIGVSKVVSKWLIDSKEIPKSKSLTIYNPVTLPTPRSADDIPEYTFRIGYVGRVELVKNLPALLDAFHKLFLINKNCELWFIGDGKEVIALKKKSKELGVENNVMFHGFISSPEILLKQCTVYILPSLSEGFSLALVEAMGCALPVIASAVGGAPEIIQNGINGWLIEDPNTENIFKALLKACNTPKNDLISIGWRARSSVEKSFEPKLYIEKLEALYISELLGK